MKPNLDNLKKLRATAIDAGLALEQATKQVSQIERQLEEMLDRMPSQHGGPGVRLQYGIVVDPSTLQERARAFGADQINPWREDAAPLLADYEKLCEAREKAKAEHTAGSDAIQKQIAMLAPLANDRAVAAAEAILEAAVTAIAPFFPSTEEAKTVALQFPRVIALRNRYEEGKGTLVTQANAIIETFES